MSYMDNNTKQYNIDYYLSIYIPHIAYQDANEEYIKNVFLSLNLALVKHVDFQNKYSENSKDCNSKVAFVYMEYWFNNICVENLQEKIMQDNDARIVHNDPCYWILKKNKRPIPNNFADELLNLHKYIIEINKQLSERITILQEENKTLYNSIQHMQWWIYQHHTNINNLLTTYNSSNVVQATPVLKNHTSSYLNNTNQTPWSKRLRKRTFPINYNDNSFDDF